MTYDILQFFVWGLFFWLVVLTYQYFFSRAINRKGVNPQNLHPKWHAIAHI